MIFGIHFLLKLERDIVWPYADMRILIGLLEVLLKPQNILIRLNPASTGTKSTIILKCIIIPKFQNGIHRLNSQCGEVYIWNFINGLHLVHFCAWFNEIDLFFGHFRNVYHFFAFPPPPKTRFVFVDQHTHETIERFR